MTENKISPRAVGIIIDKGRILVMRRISGGKEYFILPGGGVKGGETALQAMVREIKEEVNLDVLACEEMFRTADGEREHIFFLVKEYIGSMRLGGEEKERMNENNQYLPTWYTEGQFLALEPFYPKNIKESVAQLFK